MTDKEAASFAVSPEHRVLHLALTGGAGTAFRNLFLVSTVWQCRNVLYRKFGMRFADAPEMAGTVFNRWQSRLFLDPNPRSPADLAGLPDIAEKDLHFILGDDGGNCHLLLSCDGKKEIVSGLIWLFDRTRDCQEQLAALEGFGSANGMPLIVAAVGCADWMSRFPSGIQLLDFIYYSRSNHCCGVDVEAVSSLSFMIRTLVKNDAPEVVRRCEEISDTVYFIPVDVTDNKLVPGTLHAERAGLPLLLCLWLADQLPGVQRGGVEGEEVTGCDFENGTLNFTLPGTRLRESVPCNYCGFTVFHPECSKHIRLPHLPETED